MFDPDAPITSAQQDLLGRHEFVRSLAGALGAWTARQSIVVGLNGPWGSGKTSVLNLLKHELAESDAADVLEFNPWEWSAQDTLLESFLAEMGGKVGLRLDSADAMRAAERWQAFSDSLTSVAAGTQGIGRLVRVLVPVLVALGVGGLSVLGGPVWKNIVLVGVLVIAVVSASSETVAAVANQMVGRARRKHETLSEAKSDVAAILRKKTKPLLVVLDDLDRLTPSQLAMMLQLVKVNADFPNTVYLLVFEREVVEKIIGDYLHVTGSEFLEKIVQVTFEMPRPTQAQIESVLFEDIDAALQGAESNAHWNTDRWSNLYLGALRGYFRSIRDVRRYGNALRFAFGMFSASGTLEANPVDLVGLEAVRAFEPTAYRLIAARRDVFAPQFGPTSSAVEAIPPLVQEVLDASKNPAGLKVLLQQLFPLCMSGPQQREFDRASWKSDLRAASPKNFDRYFSFAVADDDVSEKELAEIMTSLRSEEQFEAHLRAFIGRGLIMPLLERVIPRLAGTPVDNLAVSTALFNVGDLLTEHAPESLIDPLWLCNSLIETMLEGHGTVSNDSVILSAASMSKGVILPVGIVEREDERIVREGNEGRLLTDDGLKALRDHCLQKIREVVPSGTVGRPADLRILLTHWSGWGEADEARAWAAKQTATPLGAVEFLEAFTAKTARMSSGDYASRIEWRIDREGLSEFVSLDDLAATLRYANEDTLTDSQRNALRLFQSRA